MAKTRPSARASVLRSALLFTPFLAVTLVAFVFVLNDTLRDGLTAGRIAGLIMIGLVGLLLAYQVVQSVRDLFARTVESTGLVERRWSKNDFFLFRNSYIFVDRNVYRLTPEQYIECELGDIVRIVHYPHTAAVEDVEVLQRAGSRS